MIKKYGKIIIEEKSILVTGFEIDGQDNYWEVRRMLLQYAKGRIMDALLEEGEVNITKETE